MLRNNESTERIVATVKSLVWGLSHYKIKVTEWNYIDQMCNFWNR